MLRLSVFSALAVVLVIFAVSIGSAVSASANGGRGTGGCNIYDPSCSVGAGVGGGVSPSGGGGASGGIADPCAAYPNAAYGDKPPKVSQACADQLQGRYCNAMEGDYLGGVKQGRVGTLTVVQVAALNAALAQAGCPPVVTTGTLAQQAFGKIVFPHPSGHRSPSETLLYKGFPFSYVNLWLFYWTDPATWQTLTATASAAGLTATVSANPTELIYDPGDGSATVACAGPGRPWTDADGNNPPSGGACGYQYSKVTSSPITATETIVWKITWTGTGNTGGNIPGLSTSTSGQLNVMQIETVVTR
jgi:hypothetical protein